MKFIAFARTFLAYTYALAYEIKNQKESDLFVMTQSMLEFSIEKFDKYIDDHPIENLMIKTEIGVCQSDQYSKIMGEVSSLSLNMKVQFENAQKEFTSEGFLSRIKEGKDSVMEIEGKEIGEKTDLPLKKKKSLIGKMVSMFSKKKDGDK